MDGIRSKIKSIRVMRKLSQEKMAELLNIEQTTYSNWETGKIDLTLKNLERIAKALSVSIETLWDPKQFEDKDWKQKEVYFYQSPGWVVSEPEIEALTKAASSDKSMSAEACKKIVDTLRERCRILEQQNLALTRSLNELFDTKLQTKSV